MNAMNQQKFETATNGQLTGSDLKMMLHGGQQWLAAHVHIVNELNVFPVPDGDTGTNMALTMRAAVESIDDDLSGGAVVKAAAQGALMGARGNSGVILSQFLQGLAQVLAEQPVVSIPALAEGLAAGADLAYQSVMEPVEGTILTVSRAAAEAAQESARTEPGVTALMAAVVAGAKIAQARTPELLPLLKEAGVPDSGGQGLVYILEGMLRALTGEPVEVDEEGSEAPTWHTSLDVSHEDYGYDVQFLLRGADLEIAAIRDHMNSIGGSTLVVGDERLVKVHLHTHDPGAPLSYGARLGVVDDVVIENLQAQAEAFIGAHHLDEADAEQATPLATLAVVPGEGLAQIFHSLGVSRVLAGGQTMNPSVESLLAAINQIDGAEVLILPNNRNIILAAEQAQKLAPKKVWLVPSRTIPQGIAALLSFNPNADAETNIERMGETMQHVQSLEITQAVGQRTYNGFQIEAGDTLGLLNGDLVSVGSGVEPVLKETLARLAPDTMRAYEIMTIYVGQKGSSAEAAGLAQQVSAMYPNIEVEVHNGGQPHALYIISVE